MYSVSNSFLNAIKSPAQTFKLRGLIDFISFTDADVLQGSCTISNQCARKDEVTIGSVYIGELNITLLTTFHRILDFPIGKKITLEFSLK